MSPASHYNAFVKTSQCFCKDIIILSSRLRRVFLKPLRQTVNNGSFDYGNNRNRPLVSPVRAKRPLAENANSLKSVSG
jgi:hypothetical protein